MMKQFKVVVEKHPVGYVAYPLGPKGIVVGEDDTYEDALIDVKSANRFHIETFGRDVLEIEPPVLEAFCGGSGSGDLMNRFPVDAPKRRVVNFCDRSGALPRVT
ncbi:MAG: hypothetical protein KAS74_06795 [Methanosarcinales archaeon]|nr:hypothetical protein [Methanosarcinales archaeon]